MTDHTHLDSYSDLDNLTELELLIHYLLQTVFMVLALTGLYWALH